MAETQLKMDKNIVHIPRGEGTSSPITKFMMLLALTFAAVALAASNSSNPPTNAPIPGNYTGALRPQIHFSPPQNFMNDPNGCHRDGNGTYHLYYQCKWNVK